MSTDVSVVIVTYNHREDISGCLQSCLETCASEVIVVDNGSSDGTVPSIRRDFPEVTVVEPGENGGYGTGVNYGVDHATGEYLVVLNPDTHVESGMVESLIEPIECGAFDVTTPKILTSDGAVINTVGNINHFTGLSFVNEYGREPDTETETEFAGISGACFAMKRTDYERVGGFDEGLFLYMEDVEFSWRLQYHGLDIGVASDAIVYHEYDLEVPPEKLYHLEFGRYYVLKKYLSTSAALRLLPSLVMAEVLTFGYAGTAGIKGITAKLRALLDGATADVKTTDADGLVEQMDRQIPSDQLTRNLVDRFVVHVANTVFEYNSKLVGDGDSSEL